MAWVNLVGRMGEAADHQHRRAGRPGQPRQPAAEPDECRGMPQPSRAFRQRPVSGLVLHAVRDMRPHFMPVPFTGFWSMQMTR